MQINFLPWAGITQPITIGPVTITPWATIRTTLATNQRQFLDHYFSRYQTTTNHPIQDISIVSITNPLDDTTPDQQRTIRRAVDALMFTSIAPTLKHALAGHAITGIPNSERYALIIQRLSTFTDPIAIETRRMSHIRRVATTTFLEPWETGGTTQADQEVLHGLGKLLQSKRNARLRQRIYRTLEWFRLSNTGSPSTSDESRLVMKMTAFETLLEPGSGKRADMAAALHALTANKHMRDRTITIGKKQYTVTESAAWLDRAYKVRNAIIHGDKTTPKQFRYRGTNHLDLADAVLYEAITWELINHHVLGSSTRRFAMSWARTWKTAPSNDLITTMMTSHFDLEQYHKALRWWKQ
jgi:hypothetical protein